MQLLGPVRGMLEGYARRLLWDRNLVRDVLQESIIKAYRDFPSFVEGTNFRAWMFCYVHNEIRNWNRGSLRDQTLLDEVEQPYSSDEAWELVLDEPVQELLLENPERVLENCDTALAEALRELSGLDRAIFLLRAIGEFRYREIAEILTVPVGTVMSSLSRSRVRLRRRLATFGLEYGLLSNEEAEDS